MGESLDDSVAMWHRNREESKAKRANNRERSAGVLTRHGVAFETKNAGAHLIVRHTVDGIDRTCDFWPGTGRYVFRSKGYRDGCGVFNLLRALKVKVTE